MKTCLILSLFVLVLISSCDRLTEKSQPEKNISKNDSIKKDNSIPKKQEEEILINIPQKIQPVFGHRFVITGDFDGDGKKEKLIEHFYSGYDRKETNKFYDGLSDYEELVDLTIRKMPYAFVSSDNKKIDSLSISSNGQLFGLSYLKNEGDLNGDGTDEVSYVVDWADWSNLNTWHIVTYKNHKWRKLYSFSIWDWQLPDLPETFNQYGLFGMENKAIETKNDEINNILENELKNFEGLVKKIKTKQIQIIYRTEEADLDSIIVDLK